MTIPEQAVEAGDLVTRLRHAITTARNDDYSQPGTDDRRRFVARIEAMEEAAEALAAAAPFMHGWRDIESGPNDGTRVLCGWRGNPDYVPLIGYYSPDPDVYLWCDDATDNSFTPQPTHWMPIPPIMEGKTDG